jgi:hypothetical protein
MIVSVTRCDKDVYRVEVDDAIVGFALKMANGLWRSYRPDMETPVDRVSHKTPKAASKVLIQATT